MIAKYLFYLFFLFHHVYIWRLDKKKTAKKLSGKTAKNFFQQKNGFQPLFLSAFFFAFCPIKPAYIYLESVPCPGHFHSLLSPSPINGLYIIFCLHHFHSYFCFSLFFLVSIRQSVRNDNWALKPYLNALYTWEQNRQHAHINTRNTTWQIKHNLHVQYHAYEISFLFESFAIASHILQLSLQIILPITEQRQTDINRLISYVWMR